MGLFSKNNSTTPGKPGAPAGAAVADPALAPAEPPKPSAPVLRPVVAAPQAMPMPQQSERQVYLQQMKLRIHQQLVERLDMQNLKSLPPEAVRGEVRMLCRGVCTLVRGRR